MHSEATENPLTYTGHTLLQGGTEKRKNEKLKRWKKGKERGGYREVKAKHVEEGIEREAGERRRERKKKNETKREGSEKKGTGEADKEKEK